MKSSSEVLTHEQYIHTVRKIAVLRLNEESRARLLEAKLVYGSGGRGTRGQCFYDAWHRTEPNALIEVCAFGEESSIQLAGTTIHELGHCLAGAGTGHGKAWKEACRTLGLIRCSAAGQAYGAKYFDPYVWDRVILLAEPSDGNPVRRRKIGVAIAAPAGAQSAPCPLGYGTRKGKSRGPGSGSRLIKVVCDRSGHGYSVWTTRMWLDAGTPTCPCGSKMSRVARR